MIKICTPATSANIGPGFDSLGLALNLYNYYYIEESDKFIIDGCPKEFRNEDNLFIKTYKEVFKYLNQDLIYIHVTFNTNIPISRGLGSSASLIIASILAANEILNHPLNTDEIINLATKIEGHPDNVVPCLLGNLCASFIDDNKVITSKIKVSDDLNYVVLIPDFKLSTAKARSVLPKMINYQDAIYNLSRIIPLVNGLNKGNINLIKASIKDKLHEPYRQELIDGYDKIKALVNNRLPLYISGAGPSLMIINNNQDISDILSKLSSNFEYKILKVCSKGSYVQYE